MTKSICINFHSPAIRSLQFKGALTWYGKLTWESVHAWNFILCLLIVWGISFINTYINDKLVDTKNGFVCIRIVGGHSFL